MKILHTSDWHLGSSLYDRKRYEEHAAFLDWLVGELDAHSIDALLVAGDVFDNTSPSNRAQELYYDFLFRVSRTCCRHVVVVGGNHDSPSFLDAPKALLKVLSVHVVGECRPVRSEEVVALLDHDKRLEAVVCAVPYLRDRDLRTVEAGETQEDRSRKLVEGLKAHYAEVCRVGEDRRKDEDVPLIAMGHLYTAGGRTVDGDGVRELYIGSLAQVGADAFPDGFDYLALGHLHVPQVVGRSEKMRYSGSPIPCGYGEAKQTKIVILVEFTGRTARVREVAVPCFQPLERISGGMDRILGRIAELKLADSTAWLEVEYTGEEFVGNLREAVDEALEGGRMECRKIRNKRLVEMTLSAGGENETLDDLNLNDVFDRCLEKYKVPLEDRPGLALAYAEIIASLQDADVGAEKGEGRT
jgi:exonuclease SbcD